jgi:hypothetical protein
MRKPFAALGLLLAVALVTGACSTMSVSTDYDRGANFAAYKSFDFIPAPEVKNPLIRERVEKAIARQLEAKGMIRSAENPDILIAAHGKLSSETHFDTTTFGYGTGAWGGYWGRYGRTGMASSTTVAREVPIGTMIIDVVDAKAKKLVWQAVASDTLDPKATPEERDARINKAMEKIFAGFPPAAM